MEDTSHWLPKVLFLGNGINIWSKGSSWNNLLISLCQNDEVRNYLENSQKKTLPMTMQAVLATNDNISEAIRIYNEKEGHNSNVNPFYGEIRTVKQREALCGLLSCRFDAILTTNYSYEIELSTLDINRFENDRYLKKINKSLTKKVDTRYLLHSYNAVNWNGHENKVFHIHGEARKPSGIVIGSYYYARLLERIINTNDKKKNKYLSNQLKGKPQNINDWMDYFILGDVYVLGFGFDFSEIDIWWLLNRKKNEKASHGKVYCYDLFKRGFDEKLKMLELMDVEIKNNDIWIEENDTKANKTEKYDALYQFAIDDICNRSSC